MEISQSQQHQQHNIAKKNSDIKQQSLELKRKKQNTNF